MNILYVNYKMCFFFNVNIFQKLSNLKYIVGLYVIAADKSEMVFESPNINFIRSITSKQGKKNTKHPYIKTKATMK